MKKKPPWCFPHSYRFGPGVVSEGKQSGLAGAFRLEGHSRSPVPEKSNCDVSQQDMCVSPGTAAGFKCPKAVWGPTRVLQCPAPPTQAGSALTFAAPWDKLHHSPIEMKNY